MILIIIIIFRTFVLLILNNIYDIYSKIKKKKSELQEHNYVQFLEFLKNYLQKKPTFFQLLSELQKEESKYYIDYERRTVGILKNKKNKKKI